MTGRARGRSRGRGRGGGGGDAARRPGEGPQEAQREQAAPVGRGRSRGPPPAQVSAPAPQRPPPAQAEPPTQAMAKMAVSQEQRPPRRSRDIVDDVATKPQHIVDKKGSTGGKITLLTNHFKLRTKPEFGVYQYNVSFNPEQESKRVRVALLRNQRAIIGEVHAFDGMMLYLPIRLPETNTVINLTKQNGDPVQMTITYTNDVLRDSPSMMQLFNIIFRRYKSFFYLACCFMFALLFAIRQICFFNFDPHCFGKARTHLESILGRNDAIFNCGKMKCRQG